MIEISTLAYSKIVLHALKYPQYSVRGVLLGYNLNKSNNFDQSDKTISNNFTVRVVDAIPAIHNNLVASNIETLFIHLDVYCEEENLKIVGLYFANQLLHDSAFDELWGRIAIDKLRFPVALQIENLKLSLNSNSSCLLAFQYDGKWKEKTCVLENNEDTITITSIAIQNKLYRELTDFENHLDQPQTADFYNTDLNLKLETIL